ncbi:MFS transporter [Chloroflexota bacterium]
MIKSTRFSKIFFGWWTVLTSGFLMLWQGGFQAWGFSAFFKPIALELNLSRAVASTAASIGSFGGGFAGPMLGWATDRYGPRMIILSGIFLWGLGMVLMYFINSLWTFLLVWGVLLGIATRITIGLPLDTAISNWFVKKRGRAISIKWVIAGLSGPLVTIVAWLIINFGWRITCVIGGGGMWLIGLPLVWFCFKRYRPEYYGLLPDGASTEEETESDQMIDKGVKYAAEVEEVEFTVRQAMRTPAFWLLIVSNTVHILAMPAISIHGIPFLTDMGIDTIVAAGILAMMVFVGIPFRLIGGFFNDRVSKHHLRFILAGAYFTQALGFTIFLLNQTTAMIYVWFILYGIGLGVSLVQMSPLRARYFGRKAFGSIQGISMAFATPVGMAAPIYTGWVYDITGSYTSAFTLIAVLLFGAAVIISFTAPPKPPAVITDIHNFL